MNTIKILSALLVTSLLLTVSCNKDEDSEDYASLENMGEIHNQLLDNYYALRVNESPTVSDLLEEVINLSGDYLVEKGMNTNEVTQAISILNSEYSPRNLKSVMNNDFSIDLNRFMSELEEMNLFSEAFNNDISKVITMVNEEVNINEIASYMNSVFCKIDYETPSDKQGQEVFISIFNGSYHYWQNSGNSNVKSVNIDDASWVIINDGIGGILGSVFGPIGSVVVATAFSVGTNEELKKKS